LSCTDQPVAGITGSSKKKNFLKDLGKIIYGIGTRFLSYCHAYGMEILASVFKIIPSPKLAALWLFG